MKLFHSTRLLGRSGEKGIYLVLFAIMLIFIVAFAALVVGLGYLSAGASRFQRVSNLVALAAMERYEAAKPTPGAPPPPLYQYKAGEALTRANEIFTANKLPGFGTSFGNISHEGDSGDGGEMVLGHWFREAPAAGPTPACQASTGYPCFEQNAAPASAPGDTTANSVMVRLKSGAGNLLKMPFCDMFGNCAKETSATAYATLIQRCTAFVMDVSASTYYTSHRITGTGIVIKTSDPANWSTAGDPVSHLPKCAGRPVTGDDIGVCARDLSSTTPFTTVDLALPFFDRDRLFLGNIAYPHPLQPNYAVVEKNLFSLNFNMCNGDYSSPSYGGHPQQKYWCNLARDPNNNWYSTRPAGPVDPTRHYRSDYKERYLNAGTGPLWLLVDSFVADGYEGPEPFTSYFHAFNAALRELEQQSSASDKAMLRGFTGEIAARYPIPPDPNAGPFLISDFGKLVQMSNVKNRGTIDIGRNAVDPEVRPNFLDFGFFWTLPTGGTSATSNNTNHALAMNDAIDALQRECPTSALRTIVLATDGVPTCFAKPGALLDSKDPTDYSCDFNDFNDYSQAASQMLNPADPKSVISRLIANQIGVVAIVAGQHVGPNFYNLDYSGRRMDPAEAYARGRTAADIFNQSSTCSGAICPDSTAYLKLGTPGFVFRKPGSLMAELSFKSGGLFCPLMPKCGSADAQLEGVCSPCCSTDPAGCTNGCYVQVPGSPAGTPCKLPDSLRPVGSEQTCSLYNLSEGEQAAKCVLDYLGGSPYVLVAPEA